MIHILFLFFVISACENSRPGVESTKERKRVIGDGDREVKGDDTAGDKSTSGGKNSFSGCGIDSFQDTSRLFRQDFASEEIEIKGVANAIFPVEYQVIIQSQLKIAGDMKSVSFEAINNIVSATPNQARNEADKKLREVSGTQTASVLAGDKWQDYYQEINQTDAYCAIIPVTKIKNDTKAYETEIEFQPPLPYLVSPKVTRSVFKREVPRRFTTHLSGTVLRSTNPNLKSGQELKGKVVFEPLNPKTSLSTDNGKVDLDAEFAYRVKLEFDLENSTLGINTDSAYYVDNGQFIAIFVKSEFQNAPTIQYLK